MANYYVSSVAYAAVAQWAASTAYTLGQYVRQLATPAAGNERVFKVTTAGTSGASEPSWNLGNNATTTSGTAIFTQVSGQEANQSAGNWKAPCANLTALSSLFTVIGSDTVFCSSDHAESRAAAVTISAAMAPHISVSRSGASLPPTQADYVAGATVTTTGASNITIGLNATNGAYMKGFVFNVGTGSSAASFLIAGDASLTVLEDCVINLVTTSDSSRITPANNSTFCADVLFKDCSVTFGATGQGFGFTNPGAFEMKGGSIAASGSVPTNLISLAKTNGFYQVLFDGVDLSACNSALFGTSAPSGQVRIINCKLHASATTPTPSSLATPSSPRSFMSLENCDSSSGNLSYAYQKFVFGGQFLTQSAIVRSGGANDGVSHYAWRLDQRATGSNSIYTPIISEWMNMRMNDTGSRTLLVEILTFINSTPTNGMHWLEAEVLEDSSSPVSTLHSSRPLSVLDTPTNLTASASAWDSNAAVRNNSASYAVGDIVAVPTNPGRVFVCATAGTSASAIPSGYATAVDGDTINDGTATFRAGYRRLLSVAITPARRGIIRARVCTRGQLAPVNADRRIAYIDPTILVA